MNFERIAALLQKFFIVTIGSIITLMFRERIVDTEYFSVYPGIAFSQMVLFLVFFFFSKEENKPLMMNITLSTGFLGILLLIINKI